MAQAIVTVLILLIFVAYAVFFSLWNPEMLRVIGWNFWPQQLWANVPTFVLPLAGVAIGAIVMAIAVSAPWSSLKSKLIAAQDQSETARSRVDECEQKVQALRSRLQKMQAQAQAQGSPEAQSASAASEEA